MIKWSKPDAQGRVFAEVNNRTIGFVKPVVASKDPEFEWDLVSLGTNVFVDRVGSCKTERGAKKALARNWQRFCDRFNLVSKASVIYAPIYPTRTEPNRSNVVSLGGRDWP